jgi:hypothetical protein
MGQGSDDERETGDLGVRRGSPAGQLEIFEPGEFEENAAAPFRHHPPRSAGRPKGSPNKRTALMRDVYLRRGYAHPMLWLGEMISLDVETLRDRLGFETIAEAADFQRKCVADLLPYLESKRPVQVDLGADRTPMLVIGRIEAAKPGAPAGDGAMAIDDDVVSAIEQNQRLSGGERDASDDEPSDDEAKG